MKVKQAWMVGALALMALTFSGYAAAEEEEEEVSDQQYCEMEAELAGIKGTAEIRAYIERCLEEVTQQNEEVEATHGYRENDGE